MKLEQAIEILTYSSEQNTMLITGDDKDALKLGIEALKAVQNARANNYYTPIATMPSETEE